MSFDEVRQEYLVKLLTHIENGNVNQVGLGMVIDRIQGYQNRNAMEDQVLQAAKERYERSRVGRDRG